MSEYLATVILGLVQGFTEFLPVSSSGHLIITSHLLGLTSESIKTFEVVIQLGSIFAVIFLYKDRFIGLTKTSTEKPFSGKRGLWLLFLTCLPASLVGLLTHSYIKAYLFNPISVSLALAVGAIFILFVEKNGENIKYKSVDEVTPELALKIGLFQCLSLWPGFSRSTSTIMGAVLLGASRPVAAEYSFLVAVPIMFAASGFELFSSLDHLSWDHLPFFALGTFVAFLSALLAIKMLMRIISRFSFKCFAWYRLAIAPLVYWFFSS